MAVQDAIGEKLGAGIRFYTQCITGARARRPHPRPTPGPLTPLRAVVCAPGFIIGFVKGWELTLVLMAVAPFLAVAGGACLPRRPRCTDSLTPSPPRLLPPAAFITKLMQELQSSEQTAYASAGSVADEILRSIRTVLAFGAQEKSARRCEARPLSPSRLLALGYSAKCLTVPLAAHRVVPGTPRS